MTNTTRCITQTSGLTEDGGAAPCDYTQAKDASDDLDYSPEQYEDFELLEPEDFLKPS